MDFFDLVGSFGPWQLRLFMVLQFMNLLGTWHNYSITFQAPNMDFHCVQPMRENGSVSALAFDDHCEVPQGQNQTLVPCTQWEYDTSYTSQTIVSEWDLVCNREWLISLAKSIYMIGFLFSVSIFGQVSDCVGRLPTIVICYFIMTVSMFLSLCSVSISMFLVLRFFQAFGRAGLTTVSFVLAMETVGKKHHTEVAIALNVGHAFGYMTLAGVAWLVRHWFWFQLVLSLSLLPFIFTYSLIPESPRWLLMRGKIDKLEKILTKAAQINGRVLDADFRDLDMVKNKIEIKGKKATTFFEILKLPKLRARILKLIYLWMVTAFVFYGLTYNTNDLAGDPYLNFFIAGVTEFPCLVLIYWAIKRWGRVPTIAVLMWMGGLTCLTILFIDTPWVKTALSLGGRFCVQGCFNVLYLYTAEVFPTSIRNVSIGSCSMCARIGSILAPFVRDLGKATHPAVPDILYSVLTVTSGLLALTLPETRGLEMPDTLQEGEDLGQYSSREERGGTTAGGAREHRK